MISHYEKTGRPLPRWFVDEPQILRGESTYLEAFWELDSERPQGFSAGPIPSSAIREYAVHELELDEELAWFFRRVLRIVDNGYLRYVRSKKNAEPNADNGGEEDTVDDAEPPAPRRRGRTR